MESMSGQKVAEGGMFGLNSVGIGISYNPMP